MLSTTCIALYGCATSTLQTVALPLATIYSRPCRLPNTQAAQACPVSACKWLHPSVSTHEVSNGLHAPQAVAEEAGAEMVVLSATDVVGAYMGESERRLREAFEGAKDLAAQGRLVIVVLVEVTYILGLDPCSVWGCPFLSSNSHFFLLTHTAAFLPPIEVLACGQLPVVF